MSRSTTTLIAGTVAGAIWLLVGIALAVVVWFGLFRSDAFRLVLPETISIQYWHLAMPWPIVIPVASTVAVGGLVSLSTRAIVAHASRADRRLVVLAIWLSVVLSAGIVGAIGGVAVLVGRGAPSSLSLIGQGLPEALAPALYWGVVTGWLPAVLATTARWNAVDMSDPQAAIPLVVPLCVALVSCVIFAGSVAVVTAQALAAGLSGQPPAAVQAPIPTPTPTGTPPPERAPGGYPVDPSWCVSSQLTFADRGGDAATGHREEAVSVMNSSRTDCVLPGYPDAAFADDHGFAVAAVVHQGGGFMTADPGPTQLTLTPGQSATTWLNWDATDGRTIIHQLYIAAYPGGERVRVMAEGGMDITASTQVAITAWAPGVVQAP